MHGSCGGIDPATFGFAFHGRAVLDAVFSTLRDEYGMGSRPNTSIMYGYVRVKRSMKMGLAWAYFVHLTARLDALKVTMS